MENVTLHRNTLDGMILKPKKTLRWRIAGKPLQMAESLNGWMQGLATLWWLVTGEDMKDHIRRDTLMPTTMPEGIRLLANGPSLKRTIAQIKADAAAWQGNNDVGFVNFLAQDEIFHLLKPRHYVLSDPLFFMDCPPLSDKHHALLRQLAETTTWTMNLHLPYVFRTETQWIADTNPNIRLVYFHTPLVRGPQWMQRMMFRKGLGNGQYGTVIQNAIYIAIHLGYKNIHLYGVDHNFFDNLALNDDNELCSRFSHFYDNGAEELRPVKITAGTPTVDEFLSYYATLFRGYRILKKYADHKGATIVNHVKTSLIDAYDRVGED